MFELWYLCTILALCTGVPLPHHQHTSINKKTYLVSRSDSLPQESNVRSVIKQIARVQHLDKAVKAASQSRVARSPSQTPQDYQMPDRSLDNSASEMSHIRSLDTSASEISHIRSLDTSSSESSQVYQMPQNSQYTTYQEAQQTLAYNGDRAYWEDTLSAPGYGDNRSGYSDTRSGYSDNRSGYSDDRAGYSDNRAGYSDNRAGRRDSRYKRKDNYDGKWDGHDDGQMAQRRQGDEAPKEPLGPPGPYRYGYAVKDDDGNDFNQQEESNGSEVRGQYSVVLPDCRVLTVSYSVTPDSGYVADVVYTPIDNCLGDTGLVPGPVSAGSETPEPQFSQQEPVFVEAALPTYGTGYRQ